MRSHNHRSERGSVLVYVALILVVLLAFVALAVDVGNLYAERRHMQNAADAGALAGAWELCFGDPSAWEATAESYATTNNRAQTADATLNNWTVNVVAGETVDTYLAGIIGINTVDVAAEAAAACGQADSACGLWPIAFSLDQWNEMLARPCGESFYVWNGNNSNNVEVDCDVYDCDVDGNGSNDIISSESRAWLDFSSAVTEEYPDSCTQSGCGANELRCQISSDSGAMLSVPVCINGDNGVKAGVHNDVDSRIGDDVNIPIFDGLCGPGGDCDSAFHAIAFGCVTVRGWHQHLVLPRLDGGNPSYQAHAVEVAVSCDPASCASYCGGTSGAPPVPWGVNAVSLVR